VSFDADALAAELARIPESAWRPHPEGHAGNSALPLIAVQGNPLDDGVAGPMRPTPVLDALPRLRRVLAALRAPLGRTRLMRLDGNAEAKLHCDLNYYWQDRYRVHVPIVTTPEVRFLCGDDAVHMAAGECWIFDTTRRHNVLNPQPTRRIHLVADTVGSAAFAALIARGRDPHGDAAAWQPQRVAIDTEAVPALHYENHNQPRVMTPWELQARIDDVLARADAASAAAVREALHEPLADWRAAWALHADAAQGDSTYAALRQRLSAAIAGLRGRASLAAVDLVDWIEHAALRAAVAAPAATPRRATRPSIARAIFIISPPRSGSSLLFETLAQAPDLYTIGGESHRLIEQIAGLAPADRGYESNRLTAQDATPAAVAALHAAMIGELRDRDGQRAGGPVTLLEKTPKNALRIPFLAAAFPQAQFVYLYRDPRETLASMLDAWQSGRFVTYPQLPDWPGPPWSLLLTPAWRALAGRSPAEIVARQWAATVEQALDDLQALPAQRWCVASYDRLVAEPQGELERLCTFLDLAWDRQLAAPLPASRHTLTSPDPDKWRRHAGALNHVLPYFEPAAQRARAVFAAPPPIAPPRRRAPTQAAPAAPPTAPDDFRSIHTANFAGILAQLGVTLAVSTYQSGRMILVRADGEALNTHLRFFPSPMGIALGRSGLALGTLNQVIEFRNQPEVAPKIEPRGRHDACFLPARMHVTGDIRVHELAYDADDTLWVVNTRFSCLCTLDGQHSFVPRWRPRYVSALVAEDRCHLNGLALDAGRPRYVTALGTTDTRQGWRDRKVDGGVLLDVTGSEVVASGLSMPHSPRVHGGRVWVLESARGEVCTVDIATGRTTTIAALPGFTRGLAFAGPFAFVGLSQVRESVFDGLPLSRRVNDAERACGVWVIDTRSGATAGFLRFSGAVQEIFDVQVLPYRYPEIAEADNDASANAFVVPDAALDG
jgi:uncharacterized protein (TIGR03032 family)